MKEPGENPRLVMVADDNRYVNDIMSEMLKEAGYEVLPVFDGLSALRLFDEQKPDLTLLDYRMPEMDGIDVLREIKRMDANAPVIFITGEGSEDVAVQAMKAGADDYISKPISFPDMLQTVNKMLRDHDIKLENLRLKERGDAYKDYLLTLSETMGDALLTTDSSGRIQFMNPVARALWGDDESQERLIDIIFNGQASQVFDKIKCDLGEVECFEDERYFTKLDGTRFFGRLSASPLKSETYAGSIVFVVRDLSDLEEMRRRMINAEKLASLGKVVEGVAHEVRNSLTSLGGFARRLENAVDTAQRSTYVGYILEDVKRLEATVTEIEDYVNYTKIHRPKFAPTDLRSVIDEALSHRLGPDGCAGIKVAIKIKTSETEIFADHNYLVEALEHLLQNACEAMSAGGLLTIEVSSNSRYMIVDVSDTGRGIPTDDVNEIFNPFYTTKVRGAGVGLSKVYLIVEEHGGYINVNSEPGQGTRIRLYLLRDKNFFIGKTEKL